MVAQGSERHALAAEPSGDSGLAGYRHEDGSAAPVFPAHPALAGADPPPLLVRPVRERLSLCASESDTAGQRGKAR